MPPPKLDSFVPTADFSDDVPESIPLRTIALRDYGGKMNFFGKISTVRCYEDNSMVSQMLDEPGQGGILFVDGGGSTIRALFGDQLGAKAVKNGWSGVIINGVIRDIAQLKSLNLGVKALGTCPRKSVKRNTGEKNVSCEVFGVVIEPGMFAMADEDGVVLLPKSKL